jgi:hypothetical protein
MEWWISSCKLIPKTLFISAFELAFLIEKLKSRNKQRRVKLAFGALKSKLLVCRKAKYIL